MGFYPVEVLVNDAKRHGVAVLPVDLNASTYKTTTEWVGRPGWALAGAAGDDGSFDDETVHPGEELPEGAGIDARPRPVRSASCVIPGAVARERWSAESATGWGVRLGLHLVKGIGEQHEELLDRELEHGPYVSLADVVERTGLPEETIERLIRTGALDSLGRPRRELLWQLREVAGRNAWTDGRADHAARRRDAGSRSADGPPAARDRGAGAAGDHASRSGSATPTRWSGSMRSARCGAVPRRARSAGRRPERRARRAAARARFGSAGWS